MKDSKYICYHSENRGTVIKTNPDQSTETTPDLWCTLKNICLNNVACGICSTFRNRTKEVNKEILSVVNEVMQ